MKVYEICLNDDYALGCYSDDNIIGKLEAADLAKKNDLSIDEWIPFKIELQRKNKKTLPGDFMYSGISEFWLVSDRAKNVLEQKYGNFIKIYPLDCTDEENRKYHAIIPTAYVEGLDFEKSDCSFYDNEHLKDIFILVHKYVFNDNIRLYPIFRLMQLSYAMRHEPVNIYHRAPIYVLDEFVQFVEEKGLTGFKFKLLYDSEADNSNEKTADTANAPADETVINKRSKNTMENYSVPMIHETGTFTLNELENGSEECVTFENEGNSITNDTNDYTLYDADDCDMANDTEVTYINGRLSTVYINCGGEKLPLYLNFEFSDGDPEELTKAVNECVGLCTEDFLNELESAETPLDTFTFEYYYDDEQMDINLQDESGNIYSIGSAAGCMLRCLCICAGDQCPDNDDKSYDVFETVVNGVHKRLSEEIPKRFEVSDDFEISEPEMYD